MGTYVFENSAASNGAVLLLDVPDISWFNDSVLAALSDMTIPANWRGNDEDYRQYALLQANRMMATYKLLNFNPFPVGMIFPYGANVAPAGYLLCDGSDYAETDFPELFTVIGTTYGSSSGRFNVPNLFNRTLVGAGDDFSFATIGGDESITLTISEMPSHSHIADAPTVVDPTHSHAESGAVTVPVLEGAVPAVAAVAVPTVTAPALTGISVLAPNINNEGGDGAHSNMQPYMALPYIIYAGR